MKNLIRTAVVVGAFAGASFATTAPASAACTNNDVDWAAHIPTVCVFYDNCDADICIGRPIDVE